MTKIKLWKTKILNTNIWGILKWQKTLWMKSQSFGNSQKPTLYHLWLGAFTVFSWKANRVCEWPHLSVCSELSGGNICHSSVGDPAKFGLSSWETWGIFQQHHHMSQACFYSPDYLIKEFGNTFNHTLNVENYDCSLG